jgi:hypothetical protein
MFSEFVDFFYFIDFIVYHKGHCFFNILYLYINILIRRFYYIGFIASSLLVITYISNE